MQISTLDRPKRTTTCKAHPKKSRLIAEAAFYYMLNRDYRFSVLLLAE